MSLIRCKRPLRMQCVTCSMATLYEDKGDAPDNSETPYAMSPGDEFYGQIEPSEISTASDYVTNDYGGLDLIRGADVILVELSENQIYEARVDSVRKGSAYLESAIFDSVFELVIFDSEWDIVASKSFTHHHFAITFIAPATDAYYVGVGTHHYKDEPVDYRLSVSHLLSTNRFVRFCNK